MEAGNQNAIRFLIVILCGIAIVLSVWTLSETQRLRQESRSRLQVHLIGTQTFPKSPRAVLPARERQSEIYEISR